MTKRKRSEHNPWTRSPDPSYNYQYSEDDLYYFKHLAHDHPKFVQRPGNDPLDIDAKRASLKAAPSVVAIVSYSGEKQLAQGCGTIIETNGNNVAVVITSANLIRRPTSKEMVENILADDLKVNIHVADGNSYRGDICAFDFHYNLLFIRFQSTLSIRAASLGHIDDSLSISPSVLEERSFELRPHLVKRKLKPGDPVFAIGRYFAKPYDLMVAPGSFSADRCAYDCKELFLVTCNITKCGDGCPVVNKSGEIIGITYYELCSLTPFLPINIAYKWWEHYKKYGRVHRHPLIGFESINFYMADLHILERITRKFPDICQGVIVEKVISGSSADSAGLCQDDVIIQCGGKIVHSFLEMLEIMWDKVGEALEMVVVRADHPTLLHISIIVAEAPSDELNSWPNWE